MTDPKNILSMTIRKFPLLFILFLVAAWTSLAAQGVCTKNDCKNGYGEYRFADGARYHGEFKNGKLHGQGVLYYPDGSKYVGNWRNQMQQGKGRLSHPDGSSYFGMWHEGQFHGEGELRFVNGNRLEATFLHGQASSSGTFYFANGDTYQGELADSRLQGHGVMQYNNGDTYIGDWHNNGRHGRGKLSLADGSNLDGNWIADHYQASWDQLGYQGPMEGLKNCGSGCHNEVGEYRYPDGTVYRGEIKEGIPNGKGSIYYPDGNQYAGLVASHRPEGLGLMRYADGLIKGGIWRKGMLYRSLYEDRGRPAAVVDVDYDPAVKIWAVIVGIERYYHMPSLRYTKSDAFYLYSHLRSPEGGALPASQIRLLVDEDANHRNIIMAMRDVYLRADENDVVLFYFSGHGLEGAFLPVDYDGFDNRLEHFELREALLATRARHKLIIADACHSGSLIADANGLAARSGGIDNKLLQYYEALNNAKAGTALLLSSKGVEYSLEDGGLRSGVFSHFLIRGLQGLADRNTDQLVSIQELFDYIHREVRIYTGNLQTPLLSGDYDPTMPVSLIRR